MKKLAILLFIFHSQVIKSQNLIPAVKVKADLDGLVTLLENIHPDAYNAFGGRMNFYRDYQKIKASIPPNGLSKEESYFLFSGFISKLHDGHTYLSYPGIAQPATKNKVFSPLSWEIASDGLFVKQTTSVYSGLKGCRLLAVEGESVDSLLKKVSQLQPCENKYGAYSNIVWYLSDVSFLSRLLKFKNDSITLTLQKPDGKLIEQTVTYSAKIGQPVPTVNSGLFHYKYLDNDHKIVWFNFRTAFSREVLEQMAAQKMGYQDILNSLYAKYYPEKKMPGNGEDAIAPLPSLTETFKRMLAEMKENSATHLIIDLRENGGGWTSSTFPTLYMLFGDRFFAHDFKIEYNKRLSSNFLSKFNTTIEEYNRTNNTSYRTGDYQFGDFVPFDSAQTTVQRRENYIKSVKRYSYNDGLLLEKINGEPVYSPKIIVVTSPSTFSAAFHYAYFLKKLSDAPLVGVCSKQSGNTGMETINIALPNTGISGSVSCSVQMFFPNDKIAGKSLDPDYPITWDIWQKFQFDANSPLLYILSKIRSGEL